MMKGLVLASPPLPRSVAGVEQGFCSDPSGRDVLVSPDEAAAAACGDCKKLSMIAARRLVDLGIAQPGSVQLVELCMTVSDNPEEHVFLRVDGEYKDPAVEAGMPVRQIGEFIAVTVWQAPPGE